MVVNERTRCESHGDVRLEIMSCGGVKLWGSCFGAGLRR
jgi:hypothetical protein